MLRDLPALARGGLALFGAPGAGIPPSPTLSVDTRSAGFACEVLPGAAAKGPVPDIETEAYPLPADVGLFLAGGLLRAAVGLLF